MSSQWLDTDSQPSTEPSYVTTAMGSRVGSGSSGDHTGPVIPGPFVEGFATEHQQVLRDHFDASADVAAPATAPYALSSDFALVTDSVLGLAPQSAELSELVYNICGRRQVTKADEDALFDHLCVTDVCSNCSDFIPSYRAGGAEAPHLVAIRILLEVDHAKWKREFTKQCMTDGYSIEAFAEESCAAMEDALKWAPAVSPLPAWRE